MRAQRTLAQACIWVLTIAGGSAVAGPVVVTPGSLASYTYFPPAASGGEVGGGGQGGEQDSLQRCLFAPTSGNQSVSVIDDFDYSKDIKLYFRMVGGDGGSGNNGGGGGSSAILKNGVAVAVANGGDGGGRIAPEMSGTLLIKKGDTLRFVTGGGGGGGYWTPSGSIGGGGGAGYQGGGGGASHSGTSRTATGSEVGKGGSTVAGAGGYAPGMWAGTPGGSLVGGISTYANGSTAPTPGNPTGFSNFTDWNYGTVYFDPMKLRYPATQSQQGGPMGDMMIFSVLGGSGGSLGNGGAGTFDTAGRRGSFSGPNVFFSIPNCTYNCNWSYISSVMGKYPPHTEDMKLTRRIVYNDAYGSVETPFQGSSLGGQIITMYQAPTCGVLR